MSQSSSKVRDGLPVFACAGLRFECTRCGACCRGRGTVEVSEEEIERLALYLSIDREDICGEYTRAIRKGRLRLADRANGDCIFFEEGAGCTVHPARPNQCRSYPFWPAVVQSPEDWNEEAAQCEGIGRDAVVSPSEILRALDRVKSP